MGVSFSAARPAGTVDDDLRLIEDAIEKGPGTDAIVRLRRRLEEEIDLERQHWEYAAGDAPDAAIGYSGFMLYRRKVAATEGIDLEKMWGYGPADDYEAWSRLNPDVPIGQKLVGAESGCKERWFAEVCVKWEDVDSDLEPLLSHSDCDGELTPEECKQLLEPLQAAHAKLAEGAELAPTEVGPFVEFGKRLFAVIEYAAVNDCHVLFR